MAMRCHTEAKTTRRLARELEQIILPSRWRGVVDQTLNVLEYWSDESSDLARLHDVLRGLLQAYDEDRLYGWLFIITSFTIKPPIFDMTADANLDLAKASQSSPLIPQSGSKTLLHRAFAYAKCHIILLRSIL